MGHSVPLSRANADVDGVSVRASADAVNLLCRPETAIHHTCEYPLPRAIFDHAQQPPMVRAYS